MKVDHFEQKPRVEASEEATLCHTFKNIMTEAAGG